MKPLNAQLDEIRESIAAVSERVPEADSAKQTADAIADLNTRFGEFVKRLEAIETENANRAEAMEEEVNRRAGERAASIVAAQGIDPVAGHTSDPPATLTKEEAWRQYRSIPGTDPKARRAYYLEHRDLLAA